MRTTGDEQYGQPWERQDSESAKYFRVFVEYLHTAPRSLRVAWARTCQEDDRLPPSVPPGNICNASVRWRWVERAAAWDSWRAENERAAFQAERLAARKRRRAALARMAALADGRLASMGEKDLKKVRADRAFEVFLKVHEAEREELNDRPRDRLRNEDLDPGGLPAIEDVLKPPDTKEDES